MRVSQIGCGIRFLLHANSRARDLRQSRPAPQGGVTFPKFFPRSKSLVSSLAHKFNQTQLQNSDHCPMAGLQSRMAMASQFSLASAFRSLSLSVPKRPFSTTPVQQTTQQLPTHVPPYPYGPRQWYKQADTGLYGGAMIRFGNKISKGRNKGKRAEAGNPMFAERSCGAMRLIKIFSSRSHIVHCEQLRKKEV